MVDLDIAVKGYTLQQVQDMLVARIAALDGHAIVRVRAVDEGSDAVVRTLNDRGLRSIAPATMNIGWTFMGKS